LIALLKYKDLCSAGAPIAGSASHVRRKKIGSNSSDHLLGTDKTTNRDKDVERQLCALISDEFDFVFPLLNVRNPEARRN
jgi:hypothetical protein